MASPTINSSVITVIAKSTVKSSTDCTTKFSTISSTKLVAISSTTIASISFERLPTAAVNKKSIVFSKTQSQVSSMTSEKASTHTISKRSEASSIIDSINVCMSLSIASSTREIKKGMRRGTGRSARLDISKRRESRMASTDILVASSAIDEMIQPDASNTRESRMPSTDLLIASSKNASNLSMATTDLSPLDGWNHDLILFTT